MKNKTPQPQGVTVSDPKLITLDIYNKYWEISIYDEDDKPIAHAFGLTKEICIANAKRIVTSVNMHDDLIDMVKVIKQYEYKKLMPVTKVALDLLLKKIK